MCRRSTKIASLQWMALVLALFVATPAASSTASGSEAEVLPPGTVVRQAPIRTATTLAELPSGTRVEILFTQQGAEGEWAQIVLPSGVTGFVPGQALRQLTSPPSWRLANPGATPPGIARRDGQGAWRVPLRRIGNTLFVTARINDQVTTIFVVDTGASVVSISNALADRLGIDYSGRPKMALITPSGTMVSPRITLNSICVPDEAGAGVTEVEAVVATLPKVPPVIGGLLGQSFLRHFNVTIESEEGVMHLEPALSSAGACR